MILDIFSRYVVGWMVADGESAALAEKLIAETCARQNIQPGQLTLHADRGSSMISKPVAFLLADLGVTKTHSVLKPSFITDSPPVRSRRAPSSSPPPTPFIPSASPPACRGHRLNPLPFGSTHPRLCCQRTKRIDSKLNNELSHSY